MKKRILLFATFVITSIAAAYAQPRAIGLRQGYGSEISYQHGLGENMLSLDLGLAAYAGLEAAVTYDWIDPFNAVIPWANRGEWHWYMGVGGALGWCWPVKYYYGYDYGYGYIHQFYFGVTGRIGVEYDFWFPLQLSLDWRPTFGPGFAVGGGYSNAYFNTGSLYAGAICLGVRYKF